MADRPHPACATVLHWIGRLWCAVFGWKVEGAPPPLAKCVFIAAPHTSNWDMPHMIGVAWALGLKVAWMGKKQIFRWPFAGFMKALGGIPIDRSGPHNTVKTVANLINDSEQMYLVVPVSGTRARTDYWKSGFYHIACEAKVPIVCSYLDYPRAVTGIGLVMEPSGNLSNDMDRIRTFYDPYQGRYRDLKSRIRLREEDQAAA